ncbi:MAG TPA: hypothetical protein VGF75_07355, partial [Candidatus Saccharimonadales bacterium]
MPPKSVNVDGITKPPQGSPDSADLDLSLDLKAKKEPTPVKDKDREALEAELNQKPITPPKSSVESSKVNRGPAITILITLILMVLLI